MSLAWGSKFLEYSATAKIVDTSPAVFRHPKWAGEACRVQYFAHPRRVSDTHEICRDASSTQELSAKREKDLLDFQEPP
jgi:hypothetical protein